MRKLWFFSASGFFILLVALGSIPGAANALSQQYGDKLLHTLAYGFMAALYFQGYRGKRMARSIATVMTIALLGAVDESIQSFLPYRNASMADWCFDIGSALLVVSLLSWFEASRLMNRPDHTAVKPD
jgi:VanZ family protein